MRDNIGKRFWQTEGEQIIRSIKFGGYLCLFFLFLIIFAFARQLYDNIMHSKSINELTVEENQDVFYLLKEASKEVLGERIKLILDVNKFIIGAGILSNEVKEELSRKNMDPFNALVIYTKVIDNKNVNELKNKLLQRIYSWKYYNKNKCIKLSECIIDIYNGSNPFSGNIIIIPIKVKVYKN